MKQRHIAPVVSNAAICRWENEGGSLRPHSAITSAILVNDLDLDLLQRLGAGVLLEWTQLPAYLQKVLFENATLGLNPAAEALCRTRLARFLHSRDELTLHPPTL